jgi:hypothetical protein
MTDTSNSQCFDKTGDPDLPIWLLGDSRSSNEQVKKLDPKIEPLDRRHPTRHTIWTPILEVIQRHLFEHGLRLDDRKIYIQNAVTSPEYTVKNAEKLRAKIVKLQKIDEAGTVVLRQNLVAEIAGLQVMRLTEIDILGKLLKSHNPLFVLCFGEFAFECARWAKEEENPPLQKWRKWEIAELSTQFEDRIKEVKLGRITLLPLLHQSIAYSFADANADFSGRGGYYFEYVGKEIADKLILLSTDSRVKKLLLRVKQKGLESL